MKESARVRRIALCAVLPTALLVWLVAGSILITLAAAQSSQGPQLTVIVPALNVRGGPGTNYAVTTVLKQGGQADIIGRHTPSGWWQVRLGNGTTGWVSGTPSYTRVSGDTAKVPEVAAPPSTSPAVPKSGRKSTLVFQVASGGPIYVVNPDGSGLRQLTTGIDPALSPDGRQVAFTRWQNSGTGSLGSVWVINVDGSGERKVHDFVRNPKSPTWSPDGKRLAINMQQGGTLDSMCFCAGRAPTPGDCPREPPLDQNGREIPCFTRLADPGWGLRLINLESGTWADLPRDLHSFAPAWDPANSWHVIYRGDKGLVNLDVNREATWPLTNDPDDQTPAFSPDGRKIAVTYRQHDHWEVHVMNADGSGRVRLTETPLDVTLAGKPAWNNAAPTWSPDGSQIVFLTDRTGRWEIWVMNADGSKQRPLLPASVQAKLPLQYHGVDERIISWR